MQNRFNQAVDMGLGAGLMYILDPDLGRRRRKRIGKRLGKQIDRQLHMAVDTVSSAAQRTEQRAADLLPSARVALYQSLAADEELMKRARQTLSSHRSLIPATRSNGFPLGTALALLAAAALGAGLMYLLDPQMGRRRLSLMNDQAIHIESDAGEAIADTAAGLGNQARGAAAEVRQRTSDETAPDQVLAERVRYHLNGATSHPGSIQVTAHDGRVTLRGPILAGEVDALLARIRAVPGVRSVENRLEVHKEPGWMPGLQS